MVWRWPMGTIQSELNRAEAPAEAEQEPGASNAWVVAPERSAENCAMLLTDPHLTWEGLAHFHEARVHTPDGGLSGFFIVGSPLLGLGHNDHVAWAMTTGGPDTADIYEMRLNPEHPLQYEYDGEWRDATIAWIDIPVKDRVPARRMAGYTHLGPVVAEPDLARGIAYVAASPYFESDRIAEQLYAMNTATDAAAFRDALAMNQLMPQNVLYAGTDGTIGYARVGLTPVRPDGYDFSKPVPGNTSETAWDGVHPFEDLVQLVNPPQGYLQNCNVSPGVMTEDSPLKPDDYPAYIYNVSWDYQNPRGRRVLDLLRANGAMTLEDAQAVAVDVYDLLAARWQRALADALDAAGSREDIAEAAGALAAWDGNYTPDSRAATVMKFWRMACEEDTELARAIEASEPLDSAGAARLLDRLATALETLEARYGERMPAWGDVHLVGRGEVYAPSPGAEYLGGPLDTETVFDVKYREREDGRFVAYNGTMALQLILLKPGGIESYTLTPWGQSNDPDSPHYMDQGRALYANRQLKPAWYDPADLEAHVASETVLRRPPTP
jgi:acyl-homoserine-lactone acylase